MEIDKIERRVEREFRPMRDARPAFPLRTERPMRADVVWEKLRFDVERKINERTVAA